MGSLSDDLVVRFGSWSWSEEEGKKQWCWRTWNEIKGIETLVGVYILHQSHKECYFLTKSKSNYQNLIEFIQKKVFIKSIFIIYLFDLIYINNFTCIIS
jgi:hypothetical protein